MKTQKLNDIEIAYEIPTTPTELRQLADRIEFLEKNAFVGQVIRVKIDHKLALVYPVENNFSPTPSTEDKRSWDIVS